MTFTTPASEKVFASFAADGLFGPGFGVWSLGLGQTLMKSFVKNFCTLEISTLQWVVGFGFFREGPLV